MPCTLKSPVRPALVAPLCAVYGLISTPGASRSKSSQLRRYSGVCSTVVVSNVLPIIASPSDKSETASEMTVTVC